MRNLREWVDEFEADSVLELDLGGMSAQLWPDVGADIVSDWLCALERGDDEAAAEAFERYSHRWDELTLYARSS